MKRPLRTVRQVVLVGLGWFISGYKEVYKQRGRKQGKTAVDIDRKFGVIWRQSVIKVAIGSLAL